MSSRNFVLACVCLLALTVLSLPVNAQDSRGGDESVSGTGAATPERPTGDSSGPSSGDPSPLAALTQTVSTLLAPPLAEAIRSTRDRVYPQGHPMPAEVRQKLTPFFPDAVLQQVRYATEWDPTADTLPSLFLGSSTKAAMTLDDVILFRAPQGVADPLLWAYELTHVMQYRQLGLTAFATRYLTQGWELEAEAMEKAAAIGRQLSP
jgi:hypothetical protein